MIKPMADGMSEYIDTATGLPRPSYDLWEEVYLTTTYTTAVVQAALQAAADMAEVKGDKQSEVKWRAVAEDIREAAHKHLYNTERHVFYKGVRTEPNGLYKDETIDASSIFGSFMFGLFPVSSPELESSVKTFVSELQYSPGVAAFPRYEYDNYHRSDPNSKGNWWFITTLWMAQYYLETDQHEMASSILSWVNGLALRTGVMPEQVSPFDHAIIDPAPLTWTHAEFLATLLDTIHKDS